MPDYDTSLTRWFENQMPKVAKKLKLRGLDTTPLHVGGNIKLFTPRIPNSPAEGEDVTIPRVCCSLTLKNCMVGARHNFYTLDTQVRIYFYGFVERSVVQPSVDVTKEPNRDGEVWIVPHRMANWEIKPIVLGDMRLVELAEEGLRLTYVAMVQSPVAFDSGLTLQPGKAYRFTVKMNGGELASISEPTIVDASVYHEALNCYTVVN